ncbi:hypothetical protein MKP05_04445 [Halomonas sp. EGI 63088]|uniref:Uncharacterized protein n=1 Tax=Halomonas flagellata TaxID=2920385 RepID=A0ABS9RR98_9GAMM|nr:hypothetical protein [Halomonas flagellata]MCH4562383.1 hypothetical protein [Halomonas flagellata]
MTIAGKGAVLVTALLLGGMGGLVATAVAQDDGAVTLEPISVIAEAEDMRIIPLRIEEGQSDHERVLGVVRYVFEIEEPTRMQVRTHLWTATSPNKVKLRGTLYDENNELVAEGEPVGGRFTFDERLQPGHYALEVEGEFLDGSQGGGQRYYLTTPTTPAN